VSQRRFSAAPFWAGARCPPLSACGGTKSVDGGLGFGFHGHRVQGVGFRVQGLGFRVWVQCGSGGGSGSALVGSTNYPEVNWVCGKNLSTSDRNKRACSYPKLRQNILRLRLMVSSQSTFQVLSTSFLRRWPHDFERLLVRDRKGAITSRSSRRENVRPR
jgi:hypothetical protein